MENKKKMYKCFFLEFSNGWKGEKKNIFSVMAKRKKKFVCRKWTGLLPKYIARRSLYCDTRAKKKKKLVGVLVGCVIIQQLYYDRSGR